MAPFYRLFGRFFIEISKQFLIFVRFKPDFEMITRRNIFPFLIFTIFGLTAGVLTYAQSESALSQVRRLMEKGDSLRRIYRFDESLQAYESALAVPQDSLAVMEDSVLRINLKDRLLMSENGRNMMNFVDIPKVVARHLFSISDFFLFYPLKDSCWRALPNQLDSSAAHPFHRAMYIDDESSSMYWSTSDNEGIRNIYTSSLRDTLWSLPTLLNEQMTSASDEIYPMLSPDRKSLFFSSSGLYGVGGYDIYVSNWDEDSNDWGAPVNMGFPYSSPADDFLYVDTEDGRYSVFASNRDCPADSVWVYVLEFDNVSVRRAVDDPEELVRIASLYPQPMSGGEINANIPENADTRRYMSKMKSVRTLRDSVAYYAALSADGHKVPRLAALQDSLGRALDSLHKIEMEFLFKGIVIDPDELMAEAEHEIVGDESGYAFTRMNMGGPLVVNMEEPQVKFDYSFKVLDEAQFAEDQSIPSGIVYQIQLFASKNKASVKALKGLSPVYEIAGANGNRVYRVGLFRTYSDVLANLNTVKKVGFRSAFIVAYIDGKSVTVAKARAKEKEKPKVQEFYEVRMTPSGGELDQSVAAGIRQQASGKDIARTQKGDGTVVYVVGPFADKAKAEELVLFIKAMGVSDVSLNVLTK